MAAFLLSFSYLFLSLILLKKPMNKLKPFSSDFDPLRHESPSVDKVGVEERVARIQTRSIKNESKIQGLKLVLNMIDLTTLEGKDTPGKVKQMCYKAMHLLDAHPGLPATAGVPPPNSS